MTRIWYISATFALGIGIANAQDPTPRKASISTWVAQLYKDDCSLKNIVGTCDSKSPSEMPSSRLELSNCADLEVVEQALESRSQGKFGHVDKSWIDIMDVDRVTPIGINNMNGAKYCKAYFTCDIELARKIEKNLIGPHPLTAFCFALNQMNEAGNAYFIKYYIQPNGEGGQAVTAYHDRGDPF